MDQLQELEQNWAEPLHEYSQFAAIIKKLLVYRHQKHVQYEMTQENLDAKREQLEELEKSEQAARRLEEALGRGRTGADPAARANGSGSGSGGNSSGGEGDDGVNTTGTSPPRSGGLSGGDNGYLPPHPGPNPVRRRAPGMGFLSALSYTLHGMMDVDPVTARRNAISKSREQISLVSGPFVFLFSWCGSSAETANPFVIPRNPVERRYAVVTCRMLLEFDIRTRMDCHASSAYNGVIRW